MIKGILWDIDNTLLDFQAAEAQALRTCFRDFGLGPCDQALLDRYSALNLSYWKRLERGEITKAQLLPGRFQEFFQAEGIPCTRYDDFNAAYQIQLGETIVFLDHSDQLLADLHGQVKQYAVTNGAKATQERKLVNSGLIHFLDGVFISDVLGAEKPSPAFFAAVLDAIGYDREELLLVGDSLTSDIQGAVWSGIPACWYNPQGLPAPEGLSIRYIIQDLNEVRQILK
jgi:2-haloacid dehalogenase